MFSTFLLLCPNFLSFPQINYIFQARAKELQAELHQAEKKDKNGTKKKVVLRKILANITMSNNEMILLFPEVLRLMNTSDLEMKKLCFFFLTTYGHTKPETALKALPIITPDLHHNSPLFRALAIKTISSVAVTEYVEALIDPIRSLLQDEDPYVRKTACFGIARLYEYDSALIQKKGLVNDLNGLLKDQNPTVVSSALSALNDITERTPNLKLSIDKKHANTLVGLLPQCNEWFQSYVLQAIMSYVPQTQDDAINLIDRVLPRLQHANTAVVLGAIRVIVYLCNYIKHPGDQIPTLSKRIGTSLVSLVSKPSEVQFLVLRNVILLMLSKPELVTVDVRMFFCKYDDQIYVKDTKLEIIYLLANENNLHVVLKELEEYATEVDIQMARKAVRAIGKLAIKVETGAHSCVDVLLRLVSTNITYIVQETTVVMKNIFRRYPDRYESLIPVLCKHFDDLDEPEAKAAFIWILGHYADQIPNADELLEDLSLTFKDDPLDVQLVFLTACCKLFLLKPKQGETLVLKVLKWATDETDNPDLRDRGFFYWRLLSVQDTKKGSAKKIILGELPTISPESEKLESVILEELELNLGTLASIYLKPVSQVFRLAKPKFLPDSPALQKEDAIVRKHAKSMQSLPQQTRPTPTKDNSINNIHGEEMDLLSDQAGKPLSSPSSKTPDSASFNTEYRNSNTPNRNSILQRRGTQQTSKSFLHATPSNNGNLLDL